LPEQVFFADAVLVLELAAVLFLFNLNLVLKRLGAMLPDETLRHETRQFTAFNRWLLVGLIFFAIAVAALVQLPHPSPPVGKILIWIGRASNLLLIFFILLPLAMTMALIWKTKEVILDAVFGARN
jgi:thiol:disulfide interchange protein